MFELDGFGLNPGNKFGESLFGEQSLRAVKLLGELPLRKEGVHLPMTNGMQIGGLAPPFGFGDPVVGLHLGFGNHSEAQGANLRGFFSRQRSSEQLFTLDLAQHGDC